jgi:transmembrane protein DUF3566
VAQGRRVRLVVRRVEPWTVLKFSVLLFATLYLVILVAGLVLWAAATATGVRGNVEKFIGDLIASDDFHLLGETVIRASVLGGAVLVLLGTGANVLFAVLYNLISDVVGGIIVVFEERPTRRRSGRPTRPPVKLEPAEKPEALRSARQRVRRLASPIAAAPAAPEPDPLDPDGVPVPDAEPVDVTRPSD